MHRRLVDAFGNRPAGVLVGKQRAFAAPSERQFFRGAAVTRDRRKSGLERAGALDREIQHRALALDPVLAGKRVPVMTETDRSSAAVVLKDPHCPAMMPTPASGSSPLTSQRVGVVSVVS